MSEIIIQRTQPANAKDCEAIQLLAYPTLSPEELFTADHIAHHTHIFPEGQFVAIDTTSGKAVGMCAGYLTEHKKIGKRKFLDVISQGWLDEHNPNASYYYGVDMSILPSYRGKGIARMLYEARKKVCIELNLKGIVICGIMPGFAKFKEHISPYDYVNLVVDGKVFDPTLSVQMRNGFHPEYLLPNHFEDETTDGWALFMEWTNPNYIDRKAEELFKPPAYFHLSNKQETG